jgi:hypothetical protein
MAPTFRRDDTGRSGSEAAAPAAPVPRISQVAKSSCDTIEAHMIYERMLKQALSDGIISVDSTVLVVCGGSFERELFLGLGFTDVTISNLDEQYSSTLAPYKWSRQDAENLDYGDNSFLISASVQHSDAY